MESEPRVTESVWDYPRPPRVEETRRRVRIVHAGVAVADTTRALRVLETSHPPVYYIPLDDVRHEYLRHSARRTTCEFKGEAAYYDLVIGAPGKPAAGGANAATEPVIAVPDAAWYYPEPAPRFAAIRGHVAFYPGKVDACFVDEELVTPQAGDFYGGWITSDIEGPFKGGPGTSGW